MTNHKRWQQKIKKEKHQREHESGRPFLCEAQRLLWSFTGVWHVTHVTSSWLRGGKGQGKIKTRIVTWIRTGFRQGGRKGQADIQIKEKTTLPEAEWAFSEWLCLSPELNPCRKRYHCNYKQCAMLKDSFSKRLSDLSQSMHHATRYLFNRPVTVPGLRNGF